MKPAREQTNEFLQDAMTSQQRVTAFNAKEHKLDVLIEGVVSLVLVLIFSTALGLLYWYQQEEDFSDTGVGCVNDCLEPEVQK